MRELCSLEIIKMSHEVVVVVFVLFADAVFVCTGIGTVSVVVFKADVCY